MRIGFDLDKVLVDYPPLVPTTIIDKFYKKKSNGELLYRIPSKPEQYLRLITHQRYLRPPIKENLSFLQTLVKKGQHDYYLISSRFGFLEKITKKLVKRLKLDEVFQDIYFNFDNKQPHLFKDGLIKKLKIDKYVDDDYHLISYLAKNNPKSIFYWLNKNQAKPLEKNLIAITKLPQMFDKE